MGYAQVLKGLAFDATPLGKVTISQVNELSGIKIVGNQSLSGVVGATYTYDVAYMPKNTLHKGVTWEIVAGQEYADIDATTGMVTIKGTGMVTIMAKSTWSQQIYDSKDVMVTAQDQPTTQVYLIINPTSYDVTPNEPVTISVQLYNVDWEELPSYAFTSNLTADNNCITLTQEINNTWRATYNSEGSTIIACDVVYNGETYSSVLTLHAINKTQVEIDQEKSQEYIRQNGFPQACGLHMFWVENSTIPQSTYMGIITDTMSLINYCDKEVRTNRIRIPIKVSDIPEGATRIRVSFEHLPSNFTKFGICSFNEQDFNDWRNGDSIGNQNPIYDTGWIQAESHIEEAYELDKSELVKNDAYGIVLILGTDSLNHRLTYGEMENDILNRIDFITL